MLESFLKYIEREELFQPGDKILLAISGGLDSCIMAELFHRAGFSFGIAHCNFHLRGDESIRDEQFVQQLGKNYDVRFHVRHFETTSFARKNKLSIQMAARKLRYDWFDELLEKEGYALVATAHHLDDQIETFLINLARGTGIAGLHGILPKQGKIIRPLLFTSRSDLEKYSLENQIVFVEDSSNASLKYARNRIRLKIIPQFEKLNPSFRENMGVTIQKLREAETIYNAIVDKEKKRMLIPFGEGYKLQVEDVKKLVPGRTWLFELLSGFGFTSSVIKDILTSLDEPPGKIFFSPSHRLVKDRDFLLISHQPLVQTTKYYEVYPEPEADLPIRLIFTKKEGAFIDYQSGDDIASLDYDKLQLPLTIRKWRKGDHFFPLGMNNRRKLSDFFIDLKYSIPQKEALWLLCSGDDIIWIIGIRLDDRYKITSSTRNVLQVKLISNY